MEHTIKAVLARFSGNPWKAIKYCVRTAKETSNPGVKREYESLAVELNMRWNLHV